MENPTAENFQNFSNSRKTAKYLIRKSKKRFFAILESRTEVVQKHSSNRLMNFSTLCINVTTFNDYFLNVKKLNSKFRAIKNSFYGIFINSSFFMKPSSPWEVEEILGDCKSKKSMGPDGFSMHVLKLSSTMICQPLSEIFNCCINQGKFPSLLKIVENFNCNGSWLLT